MEWKIEGLIELTSPTGEQFTIDLSRSCGPTPKTNRALRSQRHSSLLDLSTKPDAEAIFESYPGLRSASAALHRARWSSGVNYSVIARAVGNDPEWRGSVSVGGLGGLAPKNGIPRIARGRNSWHVVGITNPAKLRIIERVANSIALQFGKD